MVYLLRGIYLRFPYWQMEEALTCKQFVYGQYICVCVRSIFAPYTHHKIHLYLLTPVGYIWWDITYIYLYIYIYLFQHYYSLERSWLDVECQSYNSLNPKRNPKSWQAYFTSLHPHPHKQFTNQQPTKPQTQQPCSQRAPPPPTPSSGDLAASSSSSAA